MNNESQRGMIALEACISVLTFLILLLFFSGFFVLFMVQNMTAHAILQTSQSLSLDVYAIESLIKDDDGTLGKVSDHFTEFVTRLLGSSEDSPYFITDYHWHAPDVDKTTKPEGETEPEPEAGPVVNEVAEAVKLKFVGYFAGGDENRADELLEYMNVVNGLDGLDFSLSYVEGDMLYIILNYELAYDFNLWEVDNLKVHQQACARLWKSK